MRNHLCSQPVNAFMRLGVAVLLLALLSAGLSGCFGGPDDQPDEDERSTLDWTPCQHPWPCADGSEWLANLTGPFDLLPVESATVESHDGTLLDGGIWRPDLPDGVGAPVVLQTTPYLGTCSYQSIGSLDPSCPGSPRAEARIQSTTVSGDLIAQGYAVAIFSVRGTGGSGGCYDPWGLDEQLDQVALVEWLADQPWSNGRVAMTGLSYSGTTPWGAAIHTPDALKAITVGGIVTDAYIGAASPQGAIRLGAGLFQAGTAAANSLQPPLSGFGSYAPVASERLCPGVADALTAVQQAETTDDRNEPWFQERRLVDRFGDVESAVLVMHGFQDASFHRYQEDIIWDALPNAPKAFLLGQWGHTVRFEDHLDQYEHGEGWYDLALRWYDFWLKGLGDPPPRLGNVDYEVSDGTWRNDTAWPPTAAQEEALYLSGETLSPAQGGDGRSLDLTPIDDDSTSCADDPAVSPNDAPPQLVFAAEAATTGTVIAGNPYALLEITASQPRGLFGAALFVAGPSWNCEDGGELSFLTNAAVDLRFHAGNMQGTDFPTDTPIVVRMDFYNIAHHIEPGQRLVLILRNADDLMGQHANSALTVHGTSQLVVPLIEGALGGVAPPEDAPPRPFLPAS